MTLRYPLVLFLLVMLPTLALVWRWRGRRVSRAVLAVRLLLVTLLVLALANPVLGQAAPAPGTLVILLDQSDSLEDAGKAAAFAYYGGWKSFMSEAAPPPPGGNTTPIGPAPAPAAVPGRAVGVGYWAGGWMTVHANETIYAPRGTSVQTARESAEGGRMVVNNNNYITINRAIDEEAFLARMARRLQRGY